MVELRKDGYDRVEKIFLIALKHLKNSKKFSQKKDSSKTKTEILRFKRCQERLVFLSRRAREESTRFYAQNALKDLSIKLKE